MQPDEATSPSTEDSGLFRLDPQLARQFAAAGESVEILALTEDEALLAVLREALGTQRRIWRAPSAQDAVELIMTGKVGVAVIDTQLTATDTASFCVRLRRQFPDLILMAAGGIDDQTNLVQQITTGEIYRFLHKPLSAARARQFIDAGVRRHLAGRTIVPASSEGRQRKRSGALLLIGIAAVLAAVILGVFVFGDRRSNESASSESQSSLTTSPLESATSPLASSVAKSQQSTSARQPSTTDRSTPNSGHALSATVATPRVSSRQSPLQSTPLPPEATSLQEAAAPVADTRALSGGTQTTAGGAQITTPAAASEYPQNQTPLAPTPSSESSAAPAFTSTSAPAPAASNSISTSASPAATSHAVTTPPAPTAVPAATATSPPSASKLSAREIFLANIVPAASLPRTKQVAPVYPRGALNREIDGWVELDFTIAVDGAVKDIALHSAQPENVFEKSAIDALKQWRFTPVQREGQVVEQRSRLHLTFKMQ